uniref:UspA domain-containing protein n=1 Tax=Oryza meridionalis TaxID=40149 RepID=A0A0E0D0B6_9ORYZ
MAAATDAATGDATKAAATTATTTVLVGVDYSEHSYRALEEAARLAAARFPPAEVVAVHARRPLAPAFVAIGAVAAVMSVESAEQQAMEKLIGEKARQLSAQYKVEVKVEVKDGEAKRVLCDAVGEHGAGLLVVGSHGYGPVLRALLGSVSDHCCRHASCPVMVVKMP